MSRISNKVIRQIARDLGSEDAPGKLAELREFLKNKDGAPEGSDAILTGLPEFFNTVMNTYEQYEEQNKVAIRNVQLSSQELNQSNRQLEFLNGSVNAMLEGLGQGLMFFDRAGVCSPVYSKACKALLEVDPAGQYIWDIFQLPADEAEYFQTLIALLLENQTALTFEDLVELAPSSKLHSDGRKIHLEYKPMYGGGKTIQGVLVIATDRSEEEKAQRLLAKQESDAARILRLARNRNAFQKFIAEVQDYFLAGKKALFRAEKSMEDIKRSLHTHKGLAGTFFMQAFAETVHQLEDRLIGVQDVKEACKLMASEEDTIRAQVEMIVAEAENLFGAGFVNQGQTQSLSLEKLQNFYVRHLQSNGDTKATEEFMKEFLAIPVWRTLEFFNAQVLDMAARLGKKADPCRFEGENFAILEAPYQDFFASLTHVASNIVDHAFEPEDTRLGQGKEAAGHVVVTTISKGDAFTIQIRDDGAGISEDKIREKLGRKGTDVSGLSRQEVLMAIFQPEFSTATSVTAVSGRGVGLNVVYEEIQALGGNISVDSEPGKGTSFTFTLPLVWAL
jgi:signal transduction histidine kinase